MEPWRPLNARGSPEAAKAYDALHDGIPAWLEMSVMSWIEGAFRAISDTGPTTTGCCSSSSASSGSRSTGTGAQRGRGGP